MGPALAGVKQVWCRVHGEPWRVVASGREQPALRRQHQHCWPWRRIAEVRKRKPAGWEEGVWAAQG